MIITPTDFFSPGIVDDHSIQLRWAKTPQASVIQEEGRQTGAWCGWMASVLILNDLTYNFDGGGL